MLEYLLSIYVGTVFVGLFTIVPRLNGSSAITMLSWALVSVLVPVSTYLAVVDPDRLVKEYNSEP